MYGRREATAEEVKIYEMLNEKIENLPDAQFEEALEKISDFVWSYGKERKDAYNKLRRLAKKMNCKVTNFETWYCIDWCE